MPRVLSDRDIKILSMLAPDFSGETCNGSGTAYKSILPPVANHYSKDAADFKNRILSLEPGDLQYMVDLIITGEESLHCIPPDYYYIFEKVIKEKMGEETARKVAGAYAFSCE
jgi:hypothetical protein